MKEILEWPLVYDAIEQALRSITETRTDESQPTFNQPTRIFTVPPNGKGVLLSMPGFIGNYRLKKSGRQNKENTKILNTLACKLVTSFSGNRNLNPPKPNIIGNIFMFNENTGELRAMLGATEITAWRTAAASLVATDYLFLKRTNVDDSPKTIAIIGCGVQVSIENAKISLENENKTNIFREEFMHSACAVCSTFLTFVCGIVHEIVPMISSRSFCYIGMNLKISK